MLDHKEVPSASTAHIEEAIQVKAHQVELEEDGVRIALTVVDTPGFGDQIDNDPCFGEILGYIERQFDEILSEETRIKRNPRFRDNRSAATPPVPLSPPRAAYADERTWGAPR